MTLKESLSWPGDRPDAARFTDLFEQALQILTEIPARRRVRLAADAAQVLSNESTLALAQIVEPDGPNTHAKKLLASNNHTPADNRRRIERARTTKTNPKIANGVKKGRLSPRHLDALATADKRTDGAATSDNELINTLQHTPASQIERAITNWIENQTETVTTINDRHHQQRCVHPKPGPDGLPGIFVGGSQPAIDALLATIETHANRLYQQDGGRDRTPTQHQRSHTQRMFDALTELTQSTPTGPTRPTTQRPAVVFCVDVDPHTGQIKNATQTASGPISRDHLHQILKQGATTWVAVIDESTRQPLYLGRTRRHASTAQFLALTVRDNGCVQCGAAPHRCITHHLTPYNSPNKGHTNINQMCLLCNPCHRNLHNQNQTLTQHNNHWQTRPATKHETPHPQRE